MLSQSHASSSSSRVSSQVVLFCRCGRRVVRGVDDTYINRGRPFYTCSTNKINYTSPMSFFTLITGSELFKDYIGHVILDNETFEDYVSIADCENLREKIKPTHKEIEEKLAIYLKDFLNHYVHGDKEGFLRRRAESEARRLTHEAEKIQTFGHQTSIGVSILHTIGSIYSKLAAAELGKKAIYLGVPFLVEGVRIALHCIIGGYVLKLLKVLREDNASNEELIGRATALKILGEIFQRHASSSWSRASSQVVLFCRCGRRAVRRVDDTYINKGRIFYTCSMNKDEFGYCGYFVWLDKLTEVLRHDEALERVLMEK